MLGGSALSGLSADDKNAQMLGVAGLPGLNIPSVTGQALSSMKSNLPAAQEVATGVNQFQNKELQDLLKSSIPGYEGIVTSQAQDIQNMLSGGVSQGTQDLLARQSAARGISRGYGVGGFADPNSMTNAEFLRNLGLTSEGQVERGMAASNAFRSSIPMVSPMNVGGLLGPTPTDLVQLRERERLANQQIMAQAAGMQSSGDVWGSTLGQLGGMGLGYGLMSAGSPSMAGNIGGDGTGTGGVQSFGPGTPW